MTTDRIPRPPTPLRGEIVGPDQLDVSGWTPRQITVHALDTALQALHAVTALKGGLRLEFDAIREQLKAYRATAAPPMRDPDSSWHEFDAPMRDLKAELAKRTKDENDPLTPAAARDLVTETVVALQARRELAIWRAVKAWPGRAAARAAEHLVTLAVGGLVGWLVQHFLLR